MAAIDFTVNLYKAPSNEILQNRKEFYNLQRQCDEQTKTWLNRVRGHIDRCEFPRLVSTEYLLIDKFVCELNANAREIIQSVHTWTFEQLEEYFVDQNIDIGHWMNANVISNNTINQKQQIPTSSQPPSSKIEMECEFEDYEYSKNTVDIEIVNEMDAFVEIKPKQKEPAKEKDPPTSHSATGKKRHSCNECDKSFERFHDMIRHKNSVHERIRKYQCQMCGKRFTLPTYLQRHLLTHIRAKAQQSTRLDFDSSTTNSSMAIANGSTSTAQSEPNSNTMNEVIIDVIEYDYVDYECCVSDASAVVNKIQSDHTVENEPMANEIECHKNTFDDKLLYECDECNRSFTRFSSMIRHKKAVHEGIRPYACSECGKRFAVSYDRKKHLLTHQKKRAFVKEHKA